MSKNESKKVKGLYNSSITRVRPFFQALFNMDRTGKSWLPELLRAMPMNQELAERLSLKSSPVVEGCDQKREYKDKIKLEECFECSIPPSHGFLEWALKNPDELTWPEDGKKTFKVDTQYKRECLFGYHGADAQKDTMKNGLDELKNKGVYHSKAKKEWWAFEGFTKMDCLIETEHYLLGIEGKRTDTVSPSINWFRKRNQIVRNIEVLAELAREKEKEYAFILITEDGENPLKEEHFRVSLPHNEGLVSELFKHFLGCISWEHACKATGINFNDLPYDIHSIH